MDAREALKILDGSGLRLVDAARVAIGQGKRGAVAVSVHLACDRFLADRRTAGARPDTVRYYTGILERLQARCDLTLDRLDPQWVETYLSGLPAGSRAVHWRGLKALLRWSYRQREPMIAEDWTPRVRLAVARRDTEITFLPVEVVERLLRNAQAIPALQAAAALALFAGIRPYELAADNRERLTWLSVDRKAKTIRIPAAVAKTRRARIIEGLPPALWAWLPPGAQDGPIWDHRARVLANRLRDAAQLAAGKWPQDVARHTFATYAVGAGHDISKVSLWLGHQDPGVLHRHYRGLTTAAEAERFWALRPETKSPAQA